MSLHTYVLVASLTAEEFWECRYALTSLVLVAPVALAAAVAKPAFNFVCRNVRRPIEFHDNAKKWLHGQWHTKKGSFLHGAVPWVAAITQVRAGA